MVFVGLESKWYIKVPFNEHVLCALQFENWFLQLRLFNIIDLSNTAAARLRAQQPETRNAYAARGRYAVLGSTYYG